MLTNEGQSKRKILFVITDGCVYDDCAELVEKFAEDGIEVIILSIFVENEFGENVNAITIERLDEIFDATVRLLKNSKYGRENFL